MAAILGQGNFKYEARNTKFETISNEQIRMFQTRKFRDFENSNLFRISVFEFRIFKVQTLFAMTVPG